MAPRIHIAASSITLGAVLTVADARWIQEDPPAGLVVLDVRTPEEFAQGHLDGATTIDFYAPDFADKVADVGGGIAAWIDAGLAVVTS